MRRHDLPGRRALAWLAALILVCGAAAPTFAVPGKTPGDDRPPLLESQPAPHGVRAASRLMDFKVVPGAEDSVELVLRANGGLPYELFQLNAPDRLVFDLPGVRADLARKHAEVGSEWLIRVRVAQYRVSPEPVARVVLDLDRPLAYQVSRDGDVLRVRLAGSAAPRPLPASSAAPAATAPPAPVPAAKPAPEAKPTPAAKPM